VTPRAQLEYAAKAMGLVIKIVTYGTEEVCYREVTGKDWQEYWRPHRDQADSDRMACKLRMDTRIGREFVTTVAVFDGFVKQCRIAHNNTDEDVYRAVREARLLVAAEIGKGPK
jgi:hypothetical protein